MILAIQGYSTRLSCQASVQHQGSLFDKVSDVILGFVRNTIASYLKDSFGDEFIIITVNTRTLQL